MYVRFLKQTFSFQNSVKIKQVLALQPVHNITYTVNFQPERLWMANNQDDPTIDRSVYSIHHTSRHSIVLQGSCSTQVISLYFRLWVEPHVLIFILFLYENYLIEITIKLMPILQKLIKMVFHLSLFLYFDHQMAFTLMNNTKLNITLDLLIQS